MKPEPLKGKSFDCWDDKSCMKDKEMYYEEDIKSAVEWLEIQDNIVLLKYKKKEISFKLLLQYLISNKTKAFEGVMEK